MPSCWPFSIWSKKGRKLESQDFLRLAVATSTPPDRTEKLPKTTDAVTEANTSSESPIPANSNLQLEPTKKSSQDSISISVHPPQHDPETGKHSTDLQASGLGKPERPPSIRTTVITSSKIADPVEPPRDNSDIIIAVMGATGVGKTTFIRSLVESIMNLDDHDCGQLASGTKDVMTHSIQLDTMQDRIVLVDTPGFDDSSRPNSEVLEVIAEWLSKSYKEGRLLSGLIYLHRITDVRFDAGAASTLNVFKKVYGGTGYERLALVTTMWNEVHPDKTHDMDIRLSYLQTMQWASFLQREDRAVVSRYTAEPPHVARSSALAIITDLLKHSMSTANKDKLTLQLQKEMVEDGKSLPRTEAGKAAFTLGETAKYYLKQVRGSK